MKVYDPPEEIEIPEINFDDISLYRKKCDEFIENLKNFLLKRKVSDEYTGETIKFPVADGYAFYMVASTKPLSVVHVPLYDAWEFEYIERLTKKDVIDKIKQQKAIDELFKSKRNDKNN